MAINFNIKYFLVVIFGFFPGLQAKYYDACAGWSPTVERIHAGSFSLPFTNVSPANFYVKMGNTFDVNNFEGKKIGK